MGEGREGAIVEHLDELDESLCCPFFLAVPLGLSGQEWGQGGVEEIAREDTRKNYGSVGDNEIVHECR